MQKSWSSILAAALTGAALLPPIGPASASVRLSPLALDQAGAARVLGPPSYRLAQHMVTPDAAQPPGPSVNEIGAATSPPPPPSGAAVPPPPDQKLMPPPPDKTPSPIPSPTAGQTPRQ